MGATPERELKRAVVGPRAINGTAWRKLWANSKTTRISSCRLTDFEEKAFNALPPTKIVHILTPPPPPFSCM